MSSDTPNPVFRRTVQGYGLNYDRLLLLHNIAALYSIVGVSEYKMTTEGVKRSSQSFQAAAGIFAKIKEDMAGKVNPPPEMTESSVACWEQVMLAQAQECFWAKAVIGGWQWLGQVGIREVRLIAVLRTNPQTN